MTEDEFRKKAKELGYSDWLIEETLRDREEARKLGFSNFRFETELEILKQIPIIYH
jgi:hypothetical protein